MEETYPEKFGRFTVTGVLGRGAMGVVYRAEDQALGRTVAIKTIALTGDRREREVHEARFFQEAKAAGGISHPTIITIYDVGREGDTAFIAMELLEGAELRDLIRDGRLGAARALEVAALVADGLAFAHERGVIHRDIKPSNIMVLADGRVKITDFGIARLNASTIKTQSGTILGSPQYVSPEQIGGQGFDHRSDIFSLGVALYEMLTGVRPFGGEEVSEVLFAIANTTPKPPSYLSPKLPPVVDFIIARALKKNPEERYASGTEFAADLRSCIPEVQAAEAAARAAKQSAPGEETVRVAAAPEAGKVLPIHDERLELRPSPRFDSVEGLARLAVLPADAEQTHTRAGWTVPTPRVRKRIDRARAMVAGAYGLAALAAIAIVLA
jgi:serine/threonine-protein kinase